MKTVVIWDDVSADIKFTILNGDYSHLNNIYIRSDYDDVKKINQLNAAMRTSIEFLNEFPVDVVKDGAKVIVSGSLPMSMKDLKW